MFKDLYNYRELLKTNVKKNIRGKYKASVLGVLWSFINPLLQVVVYAIVFPHLMGIQTNNYIVYLVTGIIPWTYFQNVLIGCVSCVKGNAGIIKKVYFPRIVLPISTLLSEFVNFLISCVIILVFCLIWDIGISWHIIFVPLIAAIEGIFVLGLGLIGGALDAYLQDLEYIINFLTNLLFYGTPIVYDIRNYSVESKLVQAVMMNPLTKIMNAYRNVFMDHTVPDMKALGIVFLISVGICIVGYAIFKKLEKGFAEQF